MSEREREVKLLVQSEEQLDALAQRSALGGLEVTVVTEAIQEDTYYDTVDFRLLRAGLSLRSREVDGRVKATLKEVLSAENASVIHDRGETEEDLEGTTDPASGVLGARVAPLLGGEAVRPILSLRTRRGRGRLGPVTGDGADLCLDRVEICDGPGGDVVARFSEVEVEDRGCGPDVLEAIGRELLALPGFEPSTISKMERGLDALGVSSGARGEERILDVRIRSTDRLIDAAYRVFRKHFERMKANEAGTRIGEDPEFLHDMRVSTRRLRAAFRCFQGVFGPSRLVRFNRDLKWIAKVLGDVRDLDVYLERLPEYAAGLTDLDRVPLEPYVATLIRRRERARAVMLRALDTRRYRDFVETFERFLERGPPKRPALGKARAPVTTAAPKRIRRILRRVLKRGRAVPEHPAAQALHDLRIRCKRLRYACEFFSDLYGKPMRRFIQSVVRLQDVLGAHQDACVAGETLGSYAESMAGSDDAAAQTALTLGKLIDEQDRAASASRSGFREAWQAFDRKKARRAMWG